jgi:hypothetical protein
LIKSFQRYSVGNIHDFFILSALVSSKQLAGVTPHQNTHPLLIMPAIDPRYDLSRDLEGKHHPRAETYHTSYETFHATGYGENSLNTTWLQNSKIAISFTLNYDEGAERMVLNGDFQSEPCLWRKKRQVHLRWVQDMQVQSKN